MLNKNRTQEKIQFNSTQLNIVSFINVKKANDTQSLKNNIFITDNNIESIGRGTDSLQTRCKQGQTLNWIIYAMDSQKRPDGTWPPMAKINNIVFLDENGNDVELVKSCSELKIYGGPDKIRSNFTPVYYYWAGVLKTEIPPGIYKYRLIIELDTEIPGQKNYMNLDTLSLNIHEIN